jgi:hypothetical protein
MNKKRKVAPKGPQPVKLDKVVAQVNGSNRTLLVGREVSLHKTRASLRGGRYRLTGIEREVDGRHLFTVYGPISSVKPRQNYVRAEDIKALHVKPKKVRPRPLSLSAEAPTCENCLSATCPGARGDECRERG